MVDSRTIQNQNRSYVLPLLYIVGINIVVRTLWLIYMHPPQSADFNWYFTHAVGLATGQGYVWNHHYTAYWPIGWPVILSFVIRIAGPHVLAGLIVNALLSIGIVILVFFITLNVFESVPYAVLASLMYSFLPSQIEWNAVLGSEESFTFLLLVSLYLYIRSMQHKRSLLFLVVAGLAMGIATDVRPIVLVYPVFILGYEWFIQKRSLVQGIQRVLIFFVSMMCAVLPVTIRNWRTMHHLILVSTNGGVPLWQGTRFDSGYYWPLDPKVNPLVTAPNEVVQDQMGKQIAMQHILHHPWWTIWHGILKIYSLYKVDVNSVEYTFQAVTNNQQLLYSVEVFNTIWYWVFMLFALFGIFSVFQRRIFRSRSVFLLLYMAYNTLIFGLFPAWDRYRYPLMPFFAVFAGVGLYFVFQMARSRVNKDKA